MLEGKKNGWTSNSYETLMGVEGETVHKFVTVRNSLDAGRRDWLFVFQSGWSLQIADNMSFWVNRPDRTKELLKAEYTRRQTFIESLEQVESALELYQSSEQTTKEAT